MQRLPKGALWELALLVGLGGANVVSELVGSGKGWVLGVGILLWAGYLAWRRRWDPGLFASVFPTNRPHPWGAWSLAAFTVAAGGLSGVVGVARGNWPPPKSFWLVLVLYPFWGLAQQFLLNAVLAARLRELLGAKRATLLAALGFAAVHAPDWPVMVAVFPAALFWTWVYPWVRNLPLMAAAHAVAGTLFFYLVLGRDPLHPS